MTHIGRGCVLCERGMTNISIFSLDSPNNHRRYMFNLIHHEEEIDQIEEPRL
jgi:hypothetical protein